MSLIRIKVGDKTYRTHSLDRVARRLFGVNAKAVVQLRKNGQLFGVFVTPNRKNEGIFNVRAGFDEVRGEDEEPEVNPRGPYL